jgi:hypothetical protein
LKHSWLYVHSRECHVLRLLDRGKPGSGWQRVMNDPLAAFDIGVLLRLARWMRSIRMLCCSAQLSSEPPTYFGPLSNVWFVARRAT